MRRASESSSLRSDSLWAKVDSNHMPHKDAPAKHEFESFLGRLARIAAVNNMWGSLVPAPQHLGATPSAKLAPGQGFEP